DPKLNLIAARTDFRNKKYPALGGGMGIRDEIRMIRPGFYLGRAYANGIYLLTFSLYNPVIDAAGRPPGKDADKYSAQECWPAYPMAPGPNPPTTPLAGRDLASSKHKHPPKKKHPKT